jgi:hypothetical protein
MDKYSCRKEPQRRVTEKEAGRTKLRGSATNARAEATNGSSATKARAPTHTRPRGKHLRRFLHLVLNFFILL